MAAGTETEHNHSTHSTSPPWLGLEEGGARNWDPESILYTAQRLCIEYTTNLLPFPNYIHIYIYTHIINLGVTSLYFCYKPPCVRGHQLPLTPVENSLQSEWRHNMQTTNARSSLWSASRDWKGFLQSQCLSAGKQEDIYPTYFERDKQEGKAIRQWWRWRSECYREHCSFRCCSFLLRQNRPQSALLCPFSRQGWGKEESNGLRWF